MISKYQILWLFGLLAALLAVTSPVLTAHPILGFDDFALINPLREVHSFSDYARLWNQNVILDLQPFRDLVYWVEIYIGNQTGFENFQLVNVLLWFGTISVLWQILGRLQVSSPLRETVATLTALHPIMHNAVDWAAGTKHALSAFFIMLSLFFLVRWRRTLDLLVSFLFFALAIGSHPIQIGFPLFAFVWIYSVGRIHERIAWVYLGTMSFTGLVVGALNALYFSSEAYANTGGLFAPKFRHEDFTLLCKRFLILGRDALQLALPYKPSVVSYNLERPESVIGLGLIAIAALFGWRWRQSLQLRWLLFILLPISVVLVRLTSQGGVDTYLLTPLLGLAIFLGTFGSRKFTLEISRMKRKAALVVLGFLILFGYLDVMMAKVWQSPENLWSYAFRAEGSAPAKIMYAQFLANKSSADVDEVLPIVDDLIERKTPPQNLGYILGRVIYSSRLPNDQKLALFNKYNLQTPWFDYYRSAFDAKRGQPGLANERMNVSWARSPREFVILQWFHLSDIEKKWLAMCELAHASSCDQISSRISSERLAISTAHRF